MWDSVGCQENGGFYPKWDQSRIQHISSLAKLPSSLIMPKTRYSLIILTFILAACGSDSAVEPDAGGGSVDASNASDAMPPDLSEGLFRPDHVLEVSITMAPKDFAALRLEPEVIGMPKTTCGEQPAEGPYNYYPGEITVDGEVVGNVGVRKKGSLGSLSTTRPGLKIKANEYVSGQKIYGLKRLTLNNNHQDASRISQCLGYSLFRAAGVPAPRCSFAHVQVNGEDLGIYSNVESLKKNFLGRHFADNSGNLYESGGDFRPGHTQGFQPKVNKDNPDCTDLEGVVDALQAGDASFPTEIETVVDVEAFSTYWAMEVLLNHWDGYANNRNNAFFYHDPGSDKFHFIPWGIDSLFGTRIRSTRPESVYACGSLPWRLYDHPETKATYLGRLRELLDTNWDESAILSQITAMRELIEPFADPENTGELAAEIAKVSEFVNARRAVLLAELDPVSPVWPFEDGEASCVISAGTISGTFTTEWDSLDNFAAGTGTTTGTVAGISVDSSDGFSSAGLDEDGKGVIRLFSQLPDGTFAVVFVVVQDIANVKPGTVALDIVNAIAIMSFYDPVTEVSYGGGLMIGGTLTLTSASTVTGAPIVGTITSDVREL